MQAKGTLLSFLFFSCAAAAQGAVMVNIQEATPSLANRDIGKITITETAYGLLFQPNLTGLRPGIYGFHIHENPSCLPGIKDNKIVPALQAGGHFDPQKKAAHFGPFDDRGHLGDLPALIVSRDGTATYPVLAPRIKEIVSIKNHALMIHAHSDNYSDYPTQLGGSGIRMACGVIK